MRYGPQVAVMGLVIPPPSIRPLTRASRRVVARHPVFDVEEVRFRDAAGEPKGPFSCFACPDWCNVVALTDSGELVLVWQYRFGTEAMSLELPGGVIDPGETPEVAARRELLEETGYVAGAVRALSSIHPNPALQGNACHSFVARGAKATGTQRFDSNEECEVVLVPTKDARELLAHPSFTHALCIAALQAFLLDGST